MLKKAILIFLLSFLFSQQSITNLTVGQLTDGSGLIEVNYDLLDTEETFPSFSIGVQVSIDGGEFTTFSGTQVSGDIGENVIPGTNKTIYIQAPEETYSTNVVVKIIASAHIVTSELPFTMITISSTEGISSHQGESINYSYQIMQNELTNAELVTFLETYDFALSDDQPLYDCSEYTEYYNTSNNNEEVQCDDSEALNTGSNYDCVYENQVGCTDNMAFNFSPSAIYYDCSCFYIDVISPMNSWDNPQDCDWSNVGIMNDAGTFYSIDVNGDGQDDIMIENGAGIIFEQLCSDQNSLNFPTQIIEFMQSNNISEDCYSIGDANCDYECDDGYLGNMESHNDDVSININDFFTQSISFEGSSFVIESGAGTKPAIFNYENCVDGVIVSLMLDYYGLRIPTGSEWTKSARLDNTRCWPWFSSESDCDAEAESYCNSIFTCMSDEEFSACEDSANDLFFDCQSSCNDNSNADCSALNDPFSCDNTNGCDWYEDEGFQGCQDSCTGCMNNNDGCIGDPCALSCDCCDDCSGGGMDMDTMMDCIQDCSDQYGNSYEYCNGQDVMECNFCMDQTNDCESLDSYNLVEFLDSSTYDDDDGDGLYTSDFDQYGFYSQIFANRFHYSLDNQFDCDDGDCVTIDVSDIAQYPNGISPFGLYDIIGNAPEIVKHDNNMWLVGIHPNQEHINSFCENGGTMFDENTGSGHATGLSIGAGRYFNLYGLRLSRTSQ